MFTVTPEYRFLAGPSDHEEHFLDSPMNFSSWEEVKAATTAYLHSHEDANQVFFKIEKAEEVNFLWVGFLRIPTGTGWTMDSDWYVY